MTIRMSIIMMIPMMVQTWCNDDGGDNLRIPYDDGGVLFVSRGFSLPRVIQRALCSVVGQSLEDKSIEDMLFGKQFRV